jgi:hypothetical protein
MDIILILTLTSLLNTVIQFNSPSSSYRYLYLYQHLIALLPSLPPLSSLLIQTPPSSLTSSTLPSSSGFSSASSTTTRPLPLPLPLRRYSHLSNPIHPGDPTQPPATNQPAARPRVSDALPQRRAREQHQIFPSVGFESQPGFPPARTTRPEPN